jgi:flagellar motor switch protein FliG
VRAADPQVTILALAGSSVEIVERVMRSLPLEDAEELKSAWHHLGPTPLSDIEAAQQALVELVEQLEAAGRIELPLARPPHFSAA